MASRLVLSIGSETEPGVSKHFDVEEDFEQVFEHLVPIQGAPTSALATRESLTYNKSDGSGRVIIQNHHIAWVEENPSA